MFVCPVCRSRTVTVYGENNTAKCDACGTFDALHKFEAAIIETRPGERVPEAIFPPDDIIEAARKLHLYFVRDRGAKQWKFLNVQSSDAPTVVGIEHIRTMASAFMLDLVPPLNDKLIEFITPQVVKAVFGDERKPSLNLQVAIRATLEAERK